MKEEVEEALRKGEASLGIDNIPAELLKLGGPEIIKDLTTLCHRIWKTKERPKRMDSIHDHSTPKKGNLRLCKHNRTVSLITHSCKIMPRVILNRLKGKAEEILAELQAGSSAGRSTIEQILSIRLIKGKHLVYQEDPIHFKKAFDRIWQEGLYQIIKKYNFDED